MKKLLVLGLLALLLVGCGEKDEPAVGTTEIDIESEVSVNTEEDMSDTNMEESEMNDADTAENTACLQGRWRITNFSEYFESSIGGEGVPMTVSDSGDLILTFNEDTMIMTDEDFQVTATMFGQTVPTSVEASGEAEYKVEGNTLYNLAASADVEAQDIGGTGASQGFSFEKFTTNSVKFTCDDNSLIWLKGGEYPIDIVFERV